MADSEGTAERVREAGIIAILRGAFSGDELGDIAEALVSGGVWVLEVTLNTTQALGGIERLRGLLGDRALVGAGTVRTEREVDASLDAGAQFLVSPNFDPASVARSRARKALHLPGVFTGSEAQAAFGAGCNLVKLFPADALGPAYLKALRAPLDDIGFVPTGGVDVTNLGDYVRAGAVAVGVGSALVRGPGQAPTELSERAAGLVAALERARGEPNG